MIGQASAPLRRHGLGSAFAGCIEKAGGSWNMTTPLIGELFIHGLQGEKFPFLAPAAPDLLEWTWVGTPDAPVLAGIAALDVADVIVVHEGRISDSDVPARGGEILVVAPPEAELELRDERGRLLGTESLPGPWAAPSGE